MKSNKRSDTPNHFVFLIPEILLPKLTELDKHFKHIIGYHPDRLKEIISLISMHAYEDGWAILKMQYLKKFVPQAGNYIQILIQLGILKRKNYRKNIHSFKYRFTNLYYGRYVAIPIQNPKLCRRIENTLKSINTMLSRKYPAQLKFLKRVTIDVEALDCIYQNIEDSGKFNYAISAYYRIRVRNFYLSVDRTSNRCHTNLTTLPRMLRKFIRVDGIKLKNVDISCCQPFILCMLLLSPSKYVQFANPKALKSLLIRQKPLKGEEIEKFLELVTKGDIYAYLLQEFRRLGIVNLQPNLDRLV